jgi:hypothetical protein
MESQMMFLDCPAYFGEEGSERCDLPAEVEYRYTQGSTGGQLESAKIRCPRGHWFNGPIEFLTWHFPVRMSRPPATGLEISP